MKTQVGDRRPVAGRKPRDPSGPARRVTVHLSPDEESHCCAIGGTAQAGVRRLIKDSMDTVRDA